MIAQLPISLKKTGSFESYLAYVNSQPMLSEQEEKSLFESYQQQGDLSAAQQIIMSHLRFVAYVARSYKGYNLPIEDLVQEGTIGLMKSVKKFNLDFGVRLSSFAIHYIKSEIQEYVIRNWRLVKAATTKAKRKLFFNLRRLKANSQWLNDQQRKDVAAELNVSEEDINDMEAQLAHSDYYIDSALDAEDGVQTNSAKLLEDKSENFTSELIRDDFSNKALAKIKTVIASLDERSQDILNTRWLSGEKKPHKYFAQKYGVSQERIRQIEEKAITTIKKKLATFDSSGFDRTSFRQSG